MNSRDKKETKKRSLRGEAGLQDDAFQTAGNMTDNPVSEYLTDISRYPLLKDKEELGLKRKLEAGEAADMILKTKAAEYPVTEKLVDYAIKAKGGFYTELWDEHRKELCEDLCGKDRDGLIRASKEGRAARERMVTGCLRFVVKVTKKYVGFTESMKQMDLIQEGNIGLMTGIEHFDYKKGYSLLTYCGYWIKQKTERSMTEEDRFIRLPVHASQMLGRIRVFVKHYNDEYGIDPEPALIRKELGITEEQYRLLTNNSSSGVLSLNAVVGQQGEDAETEMGSFIKSDIPTPEETCVSASFTSEVYEILKDRKYTKREIDIFERRMGLIDGSVETLESIGARYNLTRERVRQIEAKMVRMIRQDLIKKHGREDFLEMQSAACNA